MNRKVLIVDDEPSIVMTLEYALKKRKCEVFIARDGSEVLDVMQKNVPDVILLNIMMPNIDGYQTLKMIKGKEEYKNVKVVFLTAKNKPSDSEKGLEYGADKYLTKPFSIKKIVEEIQDLFEK